MMHLIDRLGEKGVEIAKAELIFFDNPAFMTGALQDSIRYELGDDAATIYAGEGLTTKYGSYAMFVEYGTGVVGDGTYPEKTDYDYDVNQHGDKGWFYPLQIGSPNSKDGTIYVHTRGMAARPFMYNTLRDLEEEVKEMGGKIIAEYIADH